MLVKKKKNSSVCLMVCLLCFCQRVEELEKENALLKSEKEEINLILQQSQTSAGNNGTWSNTTLQTQSYFRFS